MTPPSNFNLMQYFPFLAVFGIVASFWQQTRNFLLKIFRIFWKQRILTYDFAYQFYTELGKQSKIFDFDDYEIFQISYYSLKHKKNLPILFKLSHFELFLYKKYIPIFIFGNGDGTFKFQYLKFTFNFEKFLDKVVNITYNEISIKDSEKTGENRFWIEEKKGRSLKSFGANKEEEGSKPSYSNKSISPEKSNQNGYILEPYRIVSNNIDKSIGIDINDVVYSNPESKNNKYRFTKTGEYVLSQVEEWLNARNWYEERNINWRRGILLNGKPGNGKSSLVLEIAKKVEIPLYIFDLSSMDNSEFDKALNDLCNNSAIILFEDFDNIFDGRKNIAKTQNFGGLNFDYFINKLSGVNSIKNKFIFITTNYIEKIDSAVLRPGRIDEKIELLPLNKEEKLNMAYIMLNNELLVNKVMENSDELTTAEFENKCIQIALENFWNKKIT
jgi:ATPase family associated with various cellular activities (AAA)